MVKKSLFIFLCSDEKKELVDCEFDQFDEFDDFRFGHVFVFGELSLSVESLSNFRHEETHEMSSSVNFGKRFCRILKRKLRNANFVR